MSIPGLKLPSEPIRVGSTATIKLPQMKANFSGRQIQPEILGFKPTIAIPSSVADLKLNGQSILNSNTQVKISAGSKNVVEVVCR